MNIDILNEAIGGIDAYIVEEALADGEKKPKVTAFAQRPWMKWAAAAVAIVVIAAGTPLALKAINSFRNENFVAPNGSGNSGVVTPIDSSESDGSEPENSSAPDSENVISSEQSGESRPHSSEAPGVSSSNTTDEPVSSSETPADSSSGTADSDDHSGTPEGEFIKEDMPAVTYRINGEYKTFDYRKSENVLGPGSVDYLEQQVCYALDYYEGSDGVGKVIIDAASGDLIRYETTVLHDHWAAVVVENEKEVTEIARQIALNSDVALSGIEDAEITYVSSGSKYFVTLKVAEGSVEICVDNKGGLWSISVSKG